MPCWHPACLSRRAFVRRRSGAALAALVLLVLFLRLVYGAWHVFQYEIQPLDSHWKGPLIYAGFVWYETASKFSPRWQASRPDWVPPVWVISQAGAAQRRADVRRQLELHNLRFEFFDGIDGVEAYKGRGPGVRLREVRKYDRTPTSKTHQAGRLSVCALLVRYPLRRCFLSAAARASGPVQPLCPEPSDACLRTSASSRCAGLFEIVEHTLHRFCS